MHFIGDPKHDRRRRDNNGKNLFYITDHSTAVWKVKEMLYCWGNEHLIVYTFKYSSSK